jgi:hypothetical protein
MGSAETLPYNKIATVWTAFNNQRVSLIAGSPRNSHIQEVVKLAGCIAPPGIAIGNPGHGELKKYRFFHDNYTISGMRAKLYKRDTVSDCDCVSSTISGMSEGFVV